MYDIIGDIHGYAQQLKELLAKLGYVLKQGVYTHKNRKAVFVGDLTDRGPKIRETLHIVKKMVDSGNAIAVMGNHEYQHLGLHTMNGDGNYLIKRTEEKVEEVKETLAAFEKYPHEWNCFLKWFEKLPLFLDLGDVRVVHACWDFEAVEFMQNTLYNSSMSKEFLKYSTKQETPHYKAVKTLLKGKDLILPYNQPYITEEGNIVKTIRIKWWKNIQNETYSSMAVKDNWNLPETTIPFCDLYKLDIGYPEDAPPVFIGHYWRSGIPKILSNNVCCVDYSIAKNGKLVAYRWNGEKILNNENFVFVEA